MVRAIFLAISAIITFSSLLIAIALFSGGKAIQEALLHIEVRTAISLATSLNLLSIGVLIALYFFVPSNRKILYSAFCTMLGIFAFLSIVPFSGVFSGGLRLQVGEFSAIVQPFLNQESSDPSWALSVTAFLLVLIWRELKRTPPEQKAS